MYNKVFISYASEDFEYADKLYDFLLQHGYRPWLDKRELIPGQQWDYIIQNELRKSDFIILLLSSKAITKRGYVQREFNAATTYCEEKLDSDIYIIPIKLDACIIPDKLTKFQWVEYSDQDSFFKILNSLTIQKNKLIEEQKLNRALEKGFSIVEKEKVEEYGDHIPKQLLEIKFQKIETSTLESHNEINVLIENEVLKYQLHSRNNYFNYLKDQVNSEFTQNSECFGSIIFDLIDNNFISYTAFWSLYESGAAHGNYWTIGHNYLLNPVRNFNLFNLFADLPSALKILRDNIHEKLMLKAKREYDINEPSEFYLFIEEIEPKEENFENYYVRENSFHFIFNPYQITAYVFGDHHIEVSFNDLKNLFPTEIKLLKFIEQVSV